MATLYELSEQYKLLQGFQEENEGDFSLALSEIEGNIEDKAENYCKLIKNLEAEAKGFKEEEERLSKRRRAIENKVKSLKTGLEDGMKNAGMLSIKTDLFSLKIQKNPASVQVIDEAKIPKEYFITTESLVKKDILDALKAGEAIDGVELKQSESLSIR